VDFSNGRLEASPLYSEKVSGMMDTKTKRVGRSAISARFFITSKLNKTGHNVIMRRVRVTNVAVGKQLVLLIFSVCLLHYLFSMQNACAVLY